MSEIEEIDLNITQSPDLSFKKKNVKVNGSFDHDEVKGRGTDYAQNDHSNNSSSRLEEFVALSPLNQNYLDKQNEEEKKEDNEVPIGDRVYDFE